MQEIALQQRPTKSVTASAQKARRGRSSTGEFVKVQTSELDGLALDWAVAQIEGEKVCVVVVDGKPQIWFSDYVYDNFKGQPAYCDKSGKPRFLRDGKPVGLFGCAMTSYLDWSKGGAIIEREFAFFRYERVKHPSLSEPTYRVIVDEFSERGYHFGPTPRIAAMRCYVASNCGDEVDVPKELL